MRWTVVVVWALIPAALNLAHGCIGPSPEPHLRFTVIEHREIPGHCLVSLDPGNWTCHLVKLSVKNLDSHNGTWYFDLKGLDSRGDLWTYEYYDGDSPPEIRAGATQTFHVGYATPPDIELVELQFDQGRTFMVIPLD